MTGNNKWTEGWHFLRADKALGYGDRRVLVEGETITIDGEPVLCEHGLHASENILDALRYAPDGVTWCCRVQLGGTVYYDTDKAVATERTVLWMVDVSTILHEFACWCAEQALKLVDDPDPRSVAAIDAKRAWLRGEIDDDELAAARAASVAATWAAAWDAAGARVAAWDAQAEQLEKMVYAAKGNTDG